MSSYSIHAPDSYRTVPWRNGRGETLVLLSQSLPGRDEFAWRLSIAAVDTDGPFSHFPCCDRTLLLLEGRGITLRHDTGQTDQMTTRFSAAHFSGDSETVATLHQGPIRDFNVISHREHCATRVNVYEGNKQIEFVVDADVLLVFAAGGAAELLVPERELIKVDPQHLMQYDKPVQGRWRFSHGPAIVIQIFNK